MTDDQPEPDEAEIDGLESPKVKIRIDTETAPERVRVDDLPTEAEQDAADQSEHEAQVEAEPKITELTEDERKSLQSLVTVGRLTKDFDLFGFTISIQTLNSDDEIRVFRSCSSDENTSAYPRAYQTAMVAAAIRRVDNESWENTLGPVTPDEMFDQKLKRVRELYPLTVQYIYSELLSLGGRFAELAQKLGKL